MADVIPLGNVTRLDLPPDRILDAAKGQLESVIVIGYDEEGGEYFASSVADGGTALWLMERFRSALLAIPEDTQ